MRNMSQFIDLLEYAAAYLSEDGLLLAVNKGFSSFTRRKPGGLIGTEIATLTIEHTFDGTCDAPLILHCEGRKLALSVKPCQLSDGTGGFLCQETRDQSIIDPRLRFFLDHLDQGVWEYDLRTETFEVSEKWREMRGFPENSGRIKPGHTWLDDIHPEDRLGLLELFEGQTTGKTEAMSIQYRHIHRDGHWFWILCRARVMERDEDGIPVRIVGTDTDISDLKREEANRQHLSRKLELAVEASGIGIWEYDSDTEQVFWDDRMLEIYGITDGNNLRNHNFWQKHLHPEDREELLAYSEACQRLGKDFNRDYRIQRPDGGTRYVRSIARFVKTTETKGRLVGVNIDVTEDYDHAAQLEAAKEQLEYDSRHDALTGLANRRMLDETVDQLFETQPEKAQFAVIHLDLDRFKQINDSLGHAAGDAVLAHVAQNLRRIVDPNYLVSRVGGDEFVIFIPNPPSDETLGTLAQTIIDVAKQPYIFDENLCVFGISAGIAISEGKTNDRSATFINADMALYAAKEAGRGQYRFFSPKIRAKNMVHLSEKRELKEALENEEIICHFQPQFDPKTRKIVGAEALVRWESPERGTLEPSEFMDIAQNADLLARIDEHVLDIVLQAQSRWETHGIKFPPISMNISEQRLSEKAFADHLDIALAPHHAISFELAEAALVDSISKRALKNLKLIRDMKIGLELDYFGSGRSSVAALQEIAPDRVKIDRSLVAQLIDRPSQVLIIQALAKIAHLNGVDVIVEGLETLRHIDLIKPVRCLAWQGFALSEPMSKPEFETLLQEPDRVALSG